MTPSGAVPRGRPLTRSRCGVHHLFTEIASTFAERPGGYTRITKVGLRKGDAAPMAVIELVSEPLNTVRVGQTQAAKAAPAAKAEETKAEEAKVEEAKAESAEETAEATEAKKDNA